MINHHASAIAIVIVKVFVFERRVNKQGGDNLTNSLFEMADCVEHK
jgi:hypothetical protein